MYKNAQILVCAQSRAGRALCCIYTKKVERQKYLFYYIRHKEKESPS